MFRVFNIQYSICHNFYITPQLVFFMNNTNPCSFCLSFIIAKFNLNETFFRYYASIPTVHSSILCALHFLCHCTISQADVSSINRFLANFANRGKYPIFGAGAFTVILQLLSCVVTLCGKRKWRQHSEGTLLMPFRCQRYPH